MDNPLPETTQVEAAQDPVTAKPSSSRTRRLWWLLAISVPLCIWLGWLAAMNSSLVADYERLRDERAAIGAELEEIRHRNHQLEVDLLVAQESVADGQATIAEMEQQVFRLQQDIAQYKGALAPNAMTHGIRIQAFELQGTDVPGVFRYKVMVTRVGNESDTVDADLYIQVHGKMNGKTVQLSLADLTNGRSQSLALNFRYFQVVPANGSEAELMLPAGFVPESVHLTAEQNGKKVLEQAMEWTETGVGS